MSMFRGGETIDVTGDATIKLRKDEFLELLGGNFTEDEVLQHITDHRGGDPQTLLHILCGSYSTEEILEHLLNTDRDTVINSLAYTKIANLPEGSIVLPPKGDHTEAEEADFFEAVKSRFTTQQLLRKLGIKIQVVYM